MRTRSGEVLLTDGDPYAPSRWFDPGRVTKPSKNGNDRTEIALFVTDEIPLKVKAFDTDSQ